jgi:hypothetical protein
VFEANEIPGLSAAVDIKYAYGFWQLYPVSSPIGQAESELVSKVFVTEKSKSSESTISFDYRVVLWLEDYEGFEVQPSRASYRLDKFIYISVANKVADRVSFGTKLFVRDSGILEIYVEVGDPGLSWSEHVGPRIGVGSGSW